MSTNTDLQIAIMTPAQTAQSIQAAIDKLRDAAGDNDAIQVVLNGISAGVDDLNSVIAALVDNTERQRNEWLEEAIRQYAQGREIGQLEALTALPIAQLLSMTHQRLREHLAALGNEGKLDTDTARTLWAELTKIASHDKYLLALLAKAVQP